MSGNQDALWRGSQVATGTNAGVTLTVDHTNATNFATKRIPTNIAVSISPRHVSVAGDLAAVVTIESPSGTVLWKKSYSAAFADEIRFAYLEVVGAATSDLLVKISASTAACSASVAYDVVASPTGKALLAPALLATSI